MTTSGTDAVLTNIREAYVRPPGVFGHYGAESRGREFDALMARVRRDALAAAEHRATRAEAQSDIRGRAVVIYRERAREAEARIKAVRDVLDEYGDPEIWAEDIRRALDGDA